MPGPALRIPSNLDPAVVDYCQQDDGADDGHEKSGRVKHRSVGRFLDQRADETADQRTQDADDGRHPKAVNHARNEPVRDQTDEEADNNGPDKMDHIHSWTDLQIEPTPANSRNAQRA